MNDIVKLVLFDRKVDTSQSFEITKSMLNVENFELIFTEKS